MDAPLRPMPPSSSEFRFRLDSLDDPPPLLDPFYKTPKLNSHDPLAEKKIEIKNQIITLAKEAILDARDHANKNKIKLDQHKISLFSKAAAHSGAVAAVALAIGIIALVVFSSMSFGAPLLALGVLYGIGALRNWRAKKVAESVNKSSLAHCKTPIDPTETMKVAIEASSLFAELLKKKFPPLKITPLEVQLLMTDLTKLCETLPLKDRDLRVLENSANFLSLNYLIEEVGRAQGIELNQTKLDVQKVMEQHLASREPEVEFNQSEFFGPQEAQENFPPYSPPPKG